MKLVILLYAGFTMRGTQEGCDQFVSIDLIFQQVAEEIIDQSSYICV